MQSTRADRTILEEDGFHIVFKQDLGTDHTQVIMRNRSELMPPIAEIALAEAIIYLTGRACRPRLTARYFEDRAQLFIRDTSTLPRTGLPGPLRGSPREIHAIWKILYAFLKQYFHRVEFDSPELSKLIEEVIRSSVGTVHSFMAALLLGIENLMEKIVPLHQTATKQEVSELRNHIQQWSGLEHIRNRALSLISMAAKSSVHQSLKQLRDCAVVTKEEAFIWDALRQKVAHGRIVDYSDAQLWERHATLITMFHRLVLRLIGY
jgi:hypothetical protein